MPPFPTKRVLGCTEHMIKEEKNEGMDFFGTNRRFTGNPYHGNVDDANCHKNTFFHL